PQQEEIRTLVRRTRSDPGISAFIRRAAILHTDTALFAADLPEPPDDEPAAPLVDSRAAAAPLLSTDRHILHADGRIVGERPGNWNWGFARSLLDNLFVHDRAFVAEWYHAVAAYMLANGRHGELEKHLRHATMLMPDDLHLLFDRACYAEALGLPF